MKNLNWLLLFIILLIPIKSISAKKKAEKSDREIWCDIMYRMAAPVLSNMSEGLLKQNMLVELSPTWDGRNKNVTYMECFGRLMAGLAPWLCQCRRSEFQRLFAMASGESDIGRRRFYCREFLKKL